MFLFVINLILKQNQQFKFLVMQDYRILKVIGKGAFGDAYLGINEAQKKQYVIKQIDIKNKSRQERQHIFNEVKLLKQFHHINIVSFRDSMIDKKGILNIVMEYCEGGDMNQLIQSMQGNKIHEDRIVYWLIQIALAIFYLHEKKILHRDLKSPNIFILKGSIRLGDFGISKVLDHVRDLAKTNIGTPYYMSPQQYNHKPYSYKSDIWAFGCILYEMCNQRRPFEANNIQALGMKIVKGSFPPVSECYSKDLRHLISEMLEKNPVKRPNIIQILMKPFIKKKLIEFVKQIQSKKDQIPKQCYASLIQQAKKLNVLFQQKRTASLSKSKDTETQISKNQSLKKSQIEEERSKQKSRQNSEQKSREKQKIERSRKKQQLQNQLRKQNEQRKQMAEKLKKIQEQRKALSQKKKTQNNDQHLSEKVYQKTTNFQVNNDYHSEKYSRADSESKKKKEINQQSKKTLTGKFDLKNSATSQKASSSKIQKSTFSKTCSKKQILNKVVESKKIQHQKPSEPELVPTSVPLEEKKTFKMQQEYEMQLEDCQPEYENFEQIKEQNENQQEKQVQKRDPELRIGDNKAKEVKQIQSLVLASNQAVQEIKKGPQSLLNFFKHSEHLDPHSNQNKKIGQIKSQILENPSEAVFKPQEIQLQLKTLKQQIKMKTMHINFIRNQLSNIDFELSESQEEDTDTKQILLQTHLNKKSFNPQHAKINDRINRLKQSANTILGTDVYNKLYDYLLILKKKGRTVKRDYLEQVLGTQKIGAYHLIEQIVRLDRVLQKIPKWF